MATLPRPHVPQRVPPGAHVFPAPDPARPDDQVRLRTFDGYEVAVGPRRVIHAIARELETLVP